MSIQNPQNWNHIFIIFLAQDIKFIKWKHTKRIYINTFKSPIKTSELYIWYFYKIQHFLKNTTKFGSQYLDLYSSTYPFSKLHTKIGTNELAYYTTVTDRRDPLSVKQNRVAALLNTCAARVRRRRAHRWRQVDLHVLQSSARRMT